ncbi:MAG TPA: hypothetical protein VJ824_06325 [Bacillota bacterium]|nr:hypothetical protein [Bacillota bacterium]
MNSHNIEEPQFYYNHTQVRLDYQIEDELHVIIISIDDRPVNRMLFFSKEEALNHKHNLELALKLGAKFNDEGYWRFELPTSGRSEAQEEYYRKAIL